MKNKVTFTPTEKIQLDEIRRRIREFKGGDKKAAMIFLGMPSEVKTLKQKGILTPYGNRETKRVLNWYNLTAYGQTII